MEMLTLEGLDEIVRGSMPAPPLMRATRQPIYTAMRIPPGVPTSRIMATEQQFYPWTPSAPMQGMGKSYGILALAVLTSILLLRKVL
jgi:hypothetical protein